MMARVLTSIALAAVLGWLGFALLSLLADAQVAALAGLVTGIGCILGLRDTIVLRGMVALLAPFGVMLPALALRHMGVALGLPIPGFGAVELLVFLVVHVAFLAASMGVLRVDIYRLGYAPIPVAAMVLVVCAYAALTGNWFVALVAVLGQVGWVMHWGSSNWFDYVLHALLVPVVAVVLILRLLGI